ncbi:hypothetical protein [Nonomuraea typhae]|uniref:Minor tail protein n=1 Tax=Nonomuraea typhae TaxID=2603600 RepID=A0ABW7YLW7_9ACTN
MPRPYTAPINISTAFTAQVDIFEILAAAGKPFELGGFELGQTSEIGDAQEEQLTLVLKLATGSVTSGSGGGTSTFRPINPNDTSPGATIETGNTTKLATGSGTVVELARIPWNVRGSALYVPVPEYRHVVPADGRLVLELATTPTDSISAAVGWVAISELV